MDIEGCTEARLPGRRTTSIVGANACAQASIARLAAPRAIVRICARSAAERGVSYGERRKVAGSRRVVLAAS